MSGKTTLETFLCEKCGTHDFSVGTGLVFHEMVGIIGDRKTGIIADLAEWHIGGTDITVGKTALTGGNRNAGRSLGGSTKGTNGR
jgi:hypothetical protein